MRRLTFSGASDDLFELEGTHAGEPDEIGCNRDLAAAVSVRTEAEGLVVSARYAPREIKVGCWIIGISPLDEGVAIPDWKMAWSLAPNGYSSMLQIDVPEDARVARLEPVGE